MKITKNNVFSTVEQFIANLNSPSWRSTFFECSREERRDWYLSNHELYHFLHDNIMRLVDSDSTSDSFKRRLLKLSRSLHCSILNYDNVYISCLLK